MDRYVPQRGEPDISLKRRGDKPDFEVKGLVTTRRSPELEPLAPHIEIWCKWPCTIPGVKTDAYSGSKQDALATKIRYLEICAVRDTSRFKRKTSQGYSLSAQGCNVELTEIEIVGHAGTSWTLGFEAFGDLEGVSTNLTLVVLPDKPALACLVASGVFLSYPAWLRIRGRE